MFRKKTLDTFVLSTFFFFFLYKRKKRVEADNERGLGVGGGRDDKGENKERKVNRQRN